MGNILINFKNMPWENPALGLRQKEYAENGQKIRLVEFSEDFIEVDWCAKGHVGYVLEGKISINFDVRIIEFKTGDGLFIFAGEENKHKASVGKGEKALLILFEKV